MTLQTLRPTWDPSQYQLLDSGDCSKLEKFGPHIIHRPEPQALWSPSQPITEWRKLSKASFVKTKGSEDKGSWMLTPEMPQQWTIEYLSATISTLRLKMRLGLTAFKHVGLFPEQAANWEFIHSRCLSLQSSLGCSPDVLNLFAYTGGASLAASTAGATVTHVDSVKQTVSWSRENYLLSSLSDSRWIVEDALKFVRRETRRQKLYHGIILDPPSYGRGADGEKWVLTENIHELLSLCSQILSPGGFLVLNLYSMGLSALLARTLIVSIFGDRSTLEQGELYLQDSFGKNLPLGVFIRF